MTDHRPRRVEHGLSPDDNVRRWQHRCNPLQRRISCGCNLDRDIAATIEAGGMTIATIDNYDLQGDPRMDVRGPSHDRRK